MRHKLHNIPDSCLYLIRVNHSEDSYHGSAWLYVAGGAEHLGSQIVEGHATHRSPRGAAGALEASHILKEMKAPGSVASVSRSQT